MRPRDSGAAGAVRGAPAARVPDGPRGPRARRLAERALRVVALLALAGVLALLVRDVLAPTGSAREMRAGSRGLRAALARWSVGEAPARAALTLDEVPGPLERDWLAALAAAGTPTAWRGDALPPTAVAVEPVADPARPSRVRVAAPVGARLALVDALGPVDSLVAAGGGAAITVPRVEGAVRARAAGAEASAEARDSLVLRRVLVIGRAGWEAKFAAAALAERGWAVDAQLAVSPAGDAVQGSPTPAIDTARYALVVALDATAAPLASRLVAYVRSGGGLVVAGEAVAAPALLPLLAASPRGEASAPGRFAADTAAPRQALALVSSGTPVAGAVTLERSDGAPAVLARRVGRGRVVQSGYLDTWRWRLGGVEPDPAAAHRAWWAALASAAAYAPRVPLAAGAFTDPMPYASLIERLGPPSSAAAARDAAPSEPAWLRPLLFGLALVSLLAEWSSRRLRGAR